MFWYWIQKNSLQTINFVSCWIKQTHILAWSIFSCCSGVFKLNIYAVVWRASSFNQNKMFVLHRNVIMSSSLPGYSLLSVQELKIAHVSIFILWDFTDLKLEHRNATELTDWTWVTLQSSQNWFLILSGFKALSYLAHKYLFLNSSAFCIIPYS